MVEITVRLGNNGYVETILSDYMCRISTHKLFTHDTDSYTAGSNTVRYVRNRNTEFLKMTLSIRRSTYAVGAHASFLPSQATEHEFAHNQTKHIRMMN